MYTFCLMDFIFLTNLRDRVFVNIRGERGEWGVTILPYPLLKICIGLRKIRGTIHKKQDVEMKK